ncbi:MAG: hypothetical protein DMG98_20025 [Acidobacteria bacterium]|nr:MAG: hypothetical protein DMG98_20025 [Acidobacteriota bacterium]
MLDPASHASTRRFHFHSLFPLSPDSGKFRNFCRLQAKVDSIPIAPHLPQAPAASSLPPYRKCLGSTSGFAEGFLSEAFPIKASDHPEVETGRSPVATDWRTY